MNMCYIQSVLLVVIKENPVKCYNMNKPRGHYAKQNSPDTEKQIMHDSIYIRYPNSQTQWNRKQNGGSQGLSGKGNGNVLSSENKDSAACDVKLLELE